jgi:hypothetical protein
MSDEIKAHAELLDDGSYHCLVQWSSTVDCNRIEWSEDEIVEHLRDDHHLTDEQIVFTGRPEPIVHRGALHSRVETLDCNYHNCLREKAFADEWEREQQERQILAHLAIVPAAPDDPHSWKPMYALDSKTRVKRAWAEIDQVSCTRSAMQQSPRRSFNGSARMLVSAGSKRRSRKQATLSSAKSSARRRSQRVSRHSKSATPHACS